jgi:hypothetical protein
MSFKPGIEAALSATAERLSPGSGQSAVKHAKNLIMSIEGSSDDTTGRFSGQDVSLAAPPIVEAKHPDGDPVEIKKHHEGLVVVYPNGCLLVRAIGFGATDVHGYGTGEVSVEAGATVHDGNEIAGLRFTPNHGKQVAAAVADAKSPGDAAAQTAVRDELLGLLGD